MKTEAIIIFLGVVMFVLGAYFSEKPEQEIMGFIAIGFGVILYRLRNIEDKLD
jgi:hypothetical protein